MPLPLIIITSTDTQKTNRQKKKKNKKKKGNQVQSNSANFPEPNNPTIHKSLLCDDRSDINEEMFNTNEHFLQMMDGDWPPCAKIRRRRKKEETFHFFFFFKL
jgi:hypothetical protein